MNTTLNLFQNMYELLQGYNFFDYDDIIMFDYVNSDGYIETVKYNITTSSIQSFTND